MSNNTRPTTLLELGMKMVEDIVCLDCSEGHCHTKGIATSSTFNKGTTWYIHITASRDFCTDPCGIYQYKGDFKIDPTNSDPRNKEDVIFETEIECVNYLLDNFYNIECIN